MGLPEGVLSVKPGGIETGQARRPNPTSTCLITGGRAVGRGRRAAEMPAAPRTRVKSAAITRDVDLAAAIPMMAFSGVMNAGQGLRQPDPHSGSALPVRRNRGCGN